MKKYFSSPLILAFFLGLSTVFAATLVAYGRNFFNTRVMTSEEISIPSIGKGSVSKDRKTIIGTMGDVMNEMIGGKSDDMIVQEIPSTTNGVDMGTVGRGFMPPLSSNDALNVNDRLYTKYATYSLVVGNVDQYMQQLQEYVVSIEGRVLSSTISSNQKYQYGYMYAKIPVIKFAESNMRVTNDVKQIISQNINAEDKTGQYVSIKDSIDELDQQKQAKEIELQTAKTDLEKSQIKYKIGQLEKQIKQLQTQQSSVEAQVEYSTLNLTVASDKRFFNPQAKPESIKEELDLAWESIKAILSVATRGLVWVIVYSLLWMPLVLFFKFATSKLSSKNKQQQSA